MTRATIRLVPRVSPPRGLRPLLPGERLTQREFHARYEQHHEEIRFELIGGVVFMVPPAGYEHGRNDFQITSIIGLYESQTPGVVGLHNVSVQLGERSEPQPDCVLCIKPEYGGQTWIKGSLLAGPPELVIEIADSSGSYDLVKKRKDYQSHGVLEYIVVSIRQQQFHWFDLANDEEREIATDGILRSIVFPGLWIDSEALFRNETRTLVETLQRGLKSKPHAAFKSQLQRRQKAIARLTEKASPSEQSPRKRRKEN